MFLLRGLKEYLRAPMQPPPPTPSPPTTLEPRGVGVWRCGLEVVVWVVVRVVWR